MRLVILLSVALLTGATSRANAAHPTTYVYVLLGGFAGADGYVDSSGMLLLARRIAWIPYTWVESYNWADWVTAANRIWALPTKDTRVVVIGYSGGGSRATWLANSILHKKIDLVVTYDPSPAWQMQNLPPNVKKAITYQNQRRFFFDLGGGELTGPNVERFQIAEEHLAVQLDERLHQITLRAIEELAK
jgi:pimeloyl-ACP methyl ester carboxylesterase